MPLADSLNKNGEDYDDGSGPTNQQQYEQQQKGGLLFATTKKTFNRTMSKVKKIKPRFNRKSNEIKMDLLNSCSSLGYDAEQDDLEQKFDDFFASGQKNGDDDDEFDCICEEDDEEEEEEEEDEDNCDASNDDDGGDGQCTQATSSCTTNTESIRSSQLYSINENEDDDDDDENNVTTNTEQNRKTNLKAPSVMRLADQKNTKLKAPSMMNLNPDQNTIVTNSSSNDQGINDDVADIPKELGCQNDEELTPEDNIVASPSKKGRGVLKKTVKAFKAIGKVTSPKFKTSSSKKSQDEPDMSGGDGVGDIESNKEGIVTGDISDDEDGSVNARDKPVDNSNDVPSRVSTSVGETKEHNGEEYKASPSKESSAISASTKGSNSPTKNKRGKTKSKKKKEPNKEEAPVMRWYRPSRNESSKLKHTPKDSNEQMRMEQSKLTKKGPEQMKEDYDHDNTNSSKRKDTVDKLESPRSDPTITETGIHEKTSLKVDEQFSKHDKRSPLLPTHSPRKKSSNHHHNHHRTSSHNSSSQRKPGSSMKSPRGRNRKQPQSPKRDHDSSSNLEQQKSDSEKNISKFSDVKEENKASSSRKTKGAQSGEKSSSSKSLPCDIDEKFNETPGGAKRSESAMGNEETLKRCSEIFAADGGGMGEYFSKIQKRDSMLSEKGSDSADLSGEDDGNDKDEDEEKSPSKSNGHRAFKTPKGLKKLFKVSKQSPKEYDKTSKETGKASTILSPQAISSHNKDDTAMVLKEMEKLSSMLSPSRTSERKPMKSESMRYTRTVSVDDPIERLDSRSMRAGTMRHSRTISVDDSPTQYFPDIPTEKKTRVSDIRRLVEESRSDSYRGSIKKESSTGSPTSVIPPGPPPDLDESNRSDSTPTQMRRRRTSRGSENEDRRTGDPSGDCLTGSSGLHDENSFREERKSLASLQLRTRHRAASQKSTGDPAASDSLTSPERSAAATDRRRRHHSRRSSSVEEKDCSEVDAARDDPVVGTTFTTDGSPTTPEKNPTGRKATTSSGRRSDGRRRSHHTNEAADKRPQSKPTEIETGGAEDHEREHERDACSHTKHRSRHSRDPAGTLKRRMSSKEVDSTKVIDSAVDVGEKEVCHDKIEPPAQVKKVSEGDPRPASNDLRSEAEGFVGGKNNQHPSSNDIVSEDASKQTTQSNEDCVDDCDGQRDKRKQCSPEKVHRRTSGHLQPAALEVGQNSVESQSTEALTTDEKTSNNERKTSLEGPSELMANHGGEVQTHLSGSGSIPFTSKRSSRSSHRRGSSRPYNKDSETCLRRNYERSASTGNVVKSGKPTHDSADPSRPHSARILRTGSGRGSASKDKIEGTSSKITEGEEEADDKVLLDSRIASRTPPRDGAKAKNSKMPSSSGSRVVRSNSDSGQGIRFKSTNSSNANRKDFNKEKAPSEKHQAVMTIPEESELQTIAPVSKGPSLAESLETGALSKQVRLFDDGQYSVSTDGDSAMFVDGQISYSCIKSSRSVCAPQLVFGSEGSGINLGVQNVPAKK